MSIFSPNPALSARVFFQRFVQLESSSSLILFGAALLSMMLANSPWQSGWEVWMEKSHFIVNEGLMTFFFLLVGLELKRGYFEGQLRHFNQILLPAFGALGGMIVPALFYVLINWHDSRGLLGWSTPVATDIAFALGVLSLFGKRVPSGLKLFLLALAVYDDLGAILIISFYFVASIDWIWAGMTGLSLLYLYGLHRYEVRRSRWFILGGVLLWFSLFRMGIHPTLAGVLFALFIPGLSEVEGSLDANNVFSFQRLETQLHPWVAYGVMPLFALMNAGFPVSHFSTLSPTNPIVWGVVVGLVIGKPLGIGLFSSLLIRKKFAKLPRDVSWLAFNAVFFLCGIGFTMSLFLAALSFGQDVSSLTTARCGIILASCLSGLLGGALLHMAFKRN